MSVERATDSLSDALSAVLLALGIGVVGGGAAIIMTMDGAAASQGGRYYVAVAAILLLGVLEGSVRRLMRRRLPWSLATQPAERRYLRRSFPLLVVASLSLLGLAHYRTVGSSTGLTYLLGYGLALGVGPLLLAFVLRRFVRTHFERGIDYLFSAAEGKAGSAPRTWTFSFSSGGPPAPADLDRGSRTVTLSPQQTARYLEEWNRIRHDFATDPSESVRRAHRLVLELCTEAGRPGVFSLEEHIGTSTLPGLGATIRLASARIAEARRVQDAVRAALAGEPAKPGDLALAMAEYERSLEELLRR